MPKRKEPEKFAPKGEKDCWHPYSLANPDSVEIYGCGRKNLDRSV